VISRSGVLQRFRSVHANFRRNPMNWFSLDA